MFKLIKDHGKVKQGEDPIYNLVLRDGDFNNLLILLQEQGYEPPISHVCCKVPNLKIKIDKHIKMKQMIGISVGSQNTVVGVLKNANVDINKLNIE